MRHQDELSEGANRKGWIPDFRPACHNALAPSTSTSIVTIAETIPTAASDRDRVESQARNIIRFTACGAMPHSRASRYEDIGALFTG